jgi:hypothetical protein
MYVIAIPARSRLPTLFRWLSNYGVSDVNGSVVNPLLLGQFLFFGQILLWVLVKGFLATDSAKVVFLSLVL